MTHVKMASWLWLCCVASLNLESAETIYTGSVADRKSTTAGAGSYAPKFSADGRYVVFLSHANNLTTNDDRRPFLDVFRHDLVSGQTILVSVSSSGRGGGDQDSAYPDISADGRHVSFVSWAGNLVNNDTNDRADVFVRDCLIGTTILGSINAAGTQSSLGVSDLRQRPSSARLSADGSKVVFDSLAPDLVAGDLNNIRDVFLRDLTSGVTTLVSPDAGVPPNSFINSNNYQSFGPMMTPDGSRVAFSTTASIPSLDLGNLRGEVCVRDIAAGVTYWASASASNFFAPPLEVGSTNPVLSANGRRVVFMATNSGRPSMMLIYHNLDNAQDTLISSNAVPRSLPAMSSDGGYVAYEESTPSGSAIQLWESLSQSKTLVSAGSGIVRSSYAPAMTPDGRFVGFVSSSSGLVTNPVTVDPQVYVRDVVAGTTRLVTVNPQGGATTDHSGVVPDISTNGSAVVFDSDATELVSGDLNRASDIFVRDLAGNATALVSRRHSLLPAAPGPSYSTISGGSLSVNGQFLLYRATDGYEMPGDTNGFFDLFVRDLAAGTNIPVTLLANGQATTNFTPRDGALSGNGRYVAYVVPGGLFAASMLVRRDLQAVIDELVTSSPGPLPGTEIRNTRYPVAISADGNQVAFLGTALPVQLFVRDMAAGTNRLATVNRLGTGACNNSCGEPILSPDGRWLLFVSTATDLVTNTLAAAPNLFARDLLNGKTEVIAMTQTVAMATGFAPAISANSHHVAFVYPTNPNRIAVYEFATKITRFATASGDFSSVRNPTLNADGRFVAFEGYKTGSSIRDIYRADLELGVTTLVSASRTGVLAGGNRTSSSPRITANGRYVAFVSQAMNLDPLVTNQISAIHLRDTLLGSTLLVSQSADGTKAANAGSALPVLSADGRTLAFESFASDVTTDDFNGSGDIFVLSIGSFDSDADGMDDAWEMAYFNGLSRDGAGDFDQDGVSDLQEFRAGTDPTNMGSVFQVLSLSRPAGGSVTALWNAVPGKLYRVQYKLSVTAPVWTDAPGDVTATGTTASKVISIAGAPPPQAQFLRVVLLQ